jgi:hypothetical protein
LKIRLPTGGTLVAPADPTHDAPSDCSHLFSFLPLVASYLASTQCLLKVLELVGPLADVVKVLDRSPELAVNVVKFLKVAEALTPCAQVSTGLGVLPFVRDLLCLILQALHCIIGQLKTIVAVMTGLVSQLNSAQAAGNTDLVQALEGETKKAQVKAADLFASIEAAQAVLDLAGPFFGTAGVQPVQLPPALATTDLNSLKQLLGSLENSAASLQVARRRARRMRRMTVYLAALPCSKHRSTRSEIFASPTHMTVSAPPQ